MKRKAPSLLKKVMAALSNKCNELRVRIMIFFLLHKNMDRRSLAHSFSHNLQALVAHPHHHSKKIHEEEEICSQFIHYDQVDGGERHHEEHLTGVLLEESEAAMEEEEEEAVAEGEHGGLDEEVVKDVVEVREENVDLAADLFIKRFKREIQLQKQHSLENQ